MSGPSTRDAAQEFAERVAAKWIYSSGDETLGELATLIAAELRAGGWKPGSSTMALSKNPEDLA